MSGAWNFKDHHRFFVKQKLMNFKINPRGKMHGKPTFKLLISFFCLAGFKRSAAYIMR